MTRAKWALAGLVCILAGAYAWTASAQVIIGAGRDKAPASLEEGLVKHSGVKDRSAEKLLKALGPAVKEQLLAGRVVELPGLGVLRVVRVDSHKDLGPGGRPIIVPARNYVEFVPAGGLDTVANQPGAVPARTVEPFEYNVRPGAAPSTRSEYLRTTRTRPR